VHVEIGGVERRYDAVGELLAGAGAIDLQTT